MVNSICSLCNEPSYTLYITRNYDKICPACKKNVDKNINTSKNVEEIMAKGGDFEREISKTLTKWLTGTEKPYKYWRMPGSGALATIHEENVNLSGDIRSISKAGDFLTDYFSIECKVGYPKTSFWQHFKHLKNFNIRDFWNQCCTDAFKGNKHPMLIYRKKGNQIILGITLFDSNCLETISDTLVTLPTISMRFDLELPDLIFYDFKEFFNSVTPGMIKELLKMENNETY